MWLWRNKLMHVQIIRGKKIYVVEVGLRMLDSKEYDK